jgi:Protein of unknown function (DUF2934)
MPRRKSADAAESAPVLAEPKKTVRKTAAGKPKSATSKAAHKHHANKSTEPILETPVFEPEPANEVPVAVSAIVPSRTASHDAIARLAYSYWESRGYQSGDPQQDWLRAERELLELA